MNTPGRRPRRGAAGHLTVMPGELGADGGTPEDLQADEAAPERPYWQGRPIARRRGRGTEPPPPRSTPPSAA